MTCLGMRIQDTVHPVENGPQSDVVDDLRPLIAPLYAASARIIDAGTITTEDIRDLLSLMPRAVDLVWRRGSGPVQCDEAGETLPMPLLHFALPLDNMEAVRAFLREHGKHIACYRLDSRAQRRTAVPAERGAKRLVDRERAPYS